MSQFRTHLEMGHMLFVQKGNYFQFQTFTVYLSGRIGLTFTSANGWKRIFQNLKNPIIFRIQTRNCFSWSYSIFYFLESFWNLISKSKASTCEILEQRKSLYVCYEKTQRALLEKYEKLGCSWKMHRCKIHKMMNSE